MRWSKLWPDNERRISMPVYGQDPLGVALVQGLDALLGLARGLDVLIPGGTDLAPGLSGTGINGRRSTLALPQLQVFEGAGAALVPRNVRQQPVEGLAVRASDMPGGIGSVNGRLAAMFGEL